MKRLMWFYGGKAMIPLTQEYVAIIDAEDAYLLADHNWHARATRGSVYAVTNAYTDDEGRRSPIQMHRLITGAKKPFDVDHIDGDGLNNTRANLRIASRAENARNKGPHRNSKSGIKGVHWVPRDKCWRATIMKDGKSYRLGSFSTAEKASAAYSAAAKELHGDFAWGAEHGITFHEPSQEAA